MDKGQAAWENYKDVMSSCRDKLGRSKAQLELGLAIVIKDNEKCFYEYISRKNTIFIIYCLLGET